MSDRPIVGNDSNETRNENLPYPVVKYPSSGEFIAFRQSRDAELYFCECAREALENFIDCQTNALEDSHRDVTPENVVQHSIPDPIVDRLRDDDVTDPSQIIDVLSFEPELCHKCNDAVPKLRYCHDMYGSAFKQNYGWYIKQQSYEYGVCNSASNTLLTNTFVEKLPDDIVDLIDEEVFDDLDAKTEQFEALQKKRSRLRREINETKKEKIREVDNELSDELGFRERLVQTEEIRKKYENMDPLTPDERQELDELKAELEENSKPVKDAIENAVRRAVGHYEKGNRWTSETILYQLVQSKHGDAYTIKRHHRPDWLDGLELDIFIVEANVGIEYQGVQHYEAVDHWGGKEALEERKQRDQRTKELCSNRGVDVVEVRYDEELSGDVLREKIDPLLAPDD